MVSSPWCPVISWRKQDWTWRACFFVMQKQRYPYLTKCWIRLEDDNKKRSRPWLQEFDSVPSAEHGHITKVSCTYCSNSSSFCSSSVSGAYLVPYFILLLLIGIPLFFLELAVGQRIRRGSIGVWNYVYPQLGGIGVSSLMVSADITLSTRP